MGSPQPQVAVRSTVYRDVTPDSFEVTVRLICRAADGAAAATSLAAGFARIEQTIDSLPGPDLTIERGAVSQRKVMWRPDMGAELSTEWVAARHVVVTGRDNERAGEVMRAFAELTDTVDGIELHGPSWRIDRDNPAYGEVQADAVGEALARARRYAVTLGGRLGTLIELADTGLLGGGPVRHESVSLGFMAGGSGEGFETMDFTPVPVQISATVDARWALIVP
jgi:uncharacterized protein YggE